MTLPGFTAAASLYEARFHYVTAASSSSGGIVPQLSAGLAPPQLELCRFLCEICRYYPPYGCFACWYCAIIIILGGGENA